MLGATPNGATALAPHIWGVREPQVSLRATLPPAPAYLPACLAPAPCSACCRWLYPWPPPAGCSFIFPLLAKHPKTRPFPLLATLSVFGFSRWIFVILYSFLIPPYRRFLPLAIRYPSVLFTGDSPFPPSPPTPSPTREPPE